VPRHDSQLGQFGADHQKTMALQRVFLRAHHGYRAALQFVLGALSERRIFVARATRPCQVMPRMAMPQ
jgi:hypothetical protein